MTNLADLRLILPFALSVIVAALAVGIELAIPRRRWPTLVVSLVGLGITAAATIWVGFEPGSAFGGVYKVDDLATFLDLLFIAVAAVAIMVAPPYLEGRDLPLSEFAAAIIFALGGSILLAGAEDLLLLFLGLELLVLPGYLLAGFAKRDPLSTESAVKFFLLGSFSSAVFLFGLAFVWGLVGSTRIADVGTYLTALVEGKQALSAGFALGLAFLTAGVGFKIAAVPFHFWTPDVYQGSPTPVTAYLSVGPKIAGFAIVLRLFVGALGPIRSDWLIAVVVIAAATMTLGNLIAITQTNVKRMLGYSSIAHTGYMLVGMAAYAAGQKDGLGSVLFYTAGYAFANLGAFTVVAALQHRPGVTSELGSFAGLGRREPWLGALLALFLLSLTGIPPTGGFIGKAVILLNAVQGNPITFALAIVTVLNSAMAAFYYLRVIVYMYMREPETAHVPASHSGLLKAGFVVTAAVTLALGVVPGPLLDSAAQAARALLPG